LAIVSCKLLGGKIKDVLYPAASLEILHNYSLIIDDMVDNSELRRGKPTCWVKFGESIARCITIDYSAAAFQGVMRSKKPAEISNILARAMKEGVDGEILDLLFKQSDREDEPYIKNNRYKKVTKKDYFEMSGKKTASTTQTSCEIGGVVAGAKKEELKFLKRYGFDLGMAFQIQDDILDIFAKEETFGKRIGRDIIERNLGNIVILFALEEFSPGNKKRLLKIIRKEKIIKKDVKEAIELIKKTNSRQRANLLGKEFIEKAKKNLEFLPQNKWNKILNNIADFVMIRGK